MIRLLRVDEKLLHGAVVFSWVDNLNIQSILIADDEIANDKFMSMTFGLSKPSNVEMSILDLDSSMDFIKKHLKDSLQLMIIVGNLQSAEKIMNIFKEIKDLNVGYLHEFGKGIEVNEGIHLTDEEFDICKTLQQEGVKIDLRQRYGDKPCFFKG